MECNGAITTQTCEVSESPVVTLVINRFYRQLRSKVICRRPQKLSAVIEIILLCDIFIQGDIVNVTVILQARPEQLHRQHIFHDRKV